MIKVLLLIPTLDRSGAEKQFTLLATRLPREEFDVKAVALTRGGPYEADLKQAGVDLTVLHKRFKFDPVALFRLKQIIADWKPDILHSWLFAANAYGRLAAGKKPRPRVIVSERCVDTWKSGWQRWLDRRQISRTARLVGNSQSVTDFYRDLGVPDEKLLIIPNGVAPALRPAPQERDATLAEFDIPAGARVVGCVGRLAVQKRVRDVIWGMQLLQQLADNVYLLVVGDGPERDRLERLAEHMGCRNLIRFVGHRHDAPRLIACLDVLWLASDFEGMSNSILEAMAAGVPVVATDIPPNRELVVDGQTGFLFKVGDTTGLAQFTDRILADHSLAEKLGTAARKRVANNFSIEKMVDAHTRLYRQVVAEIASV